MRGPPAPPVPFSERAVPWIVGIGVASLLLGAVFGALGSDLGSPSSRGPSSFSRSFLGTEAFRRVLGSVGIPVVASRGDSGRRAGEDGVLVIVSPENGRSVAGLLEEAENVLLVLPKWSGRAHPFDEGWISRADLVPPEEAVVLLASAGIEARVVDAAGAVGGWTLLDGLRPDVESPRLLEGEDLEPILSCDRGILLAEAVDHAGPGRLLVLSDPDLLATGGLGRGDNGLLAVRIVEDLRGNGGTVFFDETVHGFRRETGAWRGMLRYPLLPVSLQVLGVALLAVLAGAVRFGDPSAGDGDAAPGKRVLIDNTARLLLEGGHAGSVLLRYGRTAVREVAETLRAPGPPGSAESLRFLDRAGARRNREGEASRLVEALREASRNGERRAGALTALASRIHAWREEMTRGH